MIEKKQDDVFNNNKNVSLSACLSLLLPLLHHSKKQTLPVSVFYYLMQLRRGIMNADVKMPSVIFIGIHADAVPQRDTISRS